MRVLGWLVARLVMPDTRHVVRQRDVGGETREVNVGHPDVQRLHPGRQSLRGLWVVAILHAHSGIYPVGGHTEVLNLFGIESRTLSNGIAILVILDQEVEQFPDVFDGAVDFKAIGNQNWVVAIFRTGSAAGAITAIQPKELAHNFPINLQHKGNFYELKLE